MDKLEPILKNHFWILLVPLFSMNLWGYFSANGALKAATSTREGELKSVLSGIPEGASKPNEGYSKELKKRNEVLEKFVDEELLDLWNRQKRRMVWPAKVAADIPKHYRGPGLDNIEVVRFTYQKLYPELIREVHESVEPFVANKQGITWTPKVDFPISLIPQMKIGTLTIKSTEMWDAQEDIWMTQFILDAIRLMNKDADSETSAVIRRVLAFRLLGGDGQTSGGADAAAAAAAEGDGAGSSAYMNPAMLSGGGGAGGGAAGGKIASSVKFDPAEEFGAGGEPEGGGGAMAGPSSMMMQRPTEGEGEAADPAAEPTGPLRYVKPKDESTVKFKERGFYLSVIIQQNKMVDFLVALSNSEWPIRVVRFHFGKNPYGKDPFAKSAGSGGMGGGYPGMVGANPNAGGGESPFGSSGVGSPIDYGGSQGGGAMSGMMGGMTGGGAAGTTGYPPTALEHPDLVQLDLAGLITMYNQPESETAPAPESAEGVTPSEDAVAAEPGTTPSAEEAPAGEAPSAEPSVPATEGAPTETPATDAAPTADPPVTEEADPAGEAPATEAPAGETSAETAPAAEATPAPAGTDTKPAAPEGDPAPAVEPPAAEPPKNPEP